MPQFLETVYVAHHRANFVVRGNAQGVVSVDFCTEIGEDSIKISAEMQLIKSELLLYLDKKLQHFSVKLNPQGTDFQKKVWAMLQTIDYGKTVSYAWVAQQLGNPLLIRAAAAANGKNKLLILVPCHRVIGKSGALTGFAAGLDAKRMLLELENDTNPNLLF